jgi:hypothetical protein
MSKTGKKERIASEAEQERQEVRDAATGQFLKGHIGGPGRGKGSRNKLGEAFIESMYEAWKTSGDQVIREVIQSDPATFLRSMVALMPKEMDVNVNRYDAMTDDQLRQQFIAALREARALGVDFSPGEPARVH